MEYYVLDGLINGQSIKVRKFATRAAAEKVLSNILFHSDLQVEDDRHLDGHIEEFVCDQYTRFFIRKVCLCA